MIHDEENGPIDFSWYDFIGKTKLGLSFKETGRLTFGQFYRLYKHYKNDFDMEMRLKNANVTYAEAYLKAQQAEDYF